MTDGGLAQVAGLKGLEDLILDDTQLTDAGMVHLRDLTELRWLRLDDTAICGDGLEQFGAAYETWRSSILLALA